MRGRKHFIRNHKQIQWVGSVRCGCYCLLFLNKRNKGTNVADILNMFTDDVLYCVRERRVTPNVKGSDEVVVMKNNRRLLKVRCARCGITKTPFLPGNQAQGGGKGIFGDIAMTMGDLAIEKGIPRSLQKRGLRPGVISHLKLCETPSCRRKQSITRWTKPD